jgi:16S rRNA (guanine966-N2)-methyltransferase
MRIIGGTAGGRNLKVPKGMGVRPTPDRVRQAIFNSLGDLVDGARVLELFGGSGALSLECLSRGARSALCIELSAKHAAFIRSNYREAGLSKARFIVRVQDVFSTMAQLLKDGPQFDLVLADPPFGEKNTVGRSKSFSQRVLDDPNLPTLMTDGGLLVLGHAKRDSVEIPPTWDERKVLKHGDSVFRMLTVAMPAREQPLLEPGA